MILPFRPVVLAALLAFALTGLAAAAPHPLVRVNQIWSRPALAGDTAVVYATLEAGPAGGDRLIGVRSPVATSAEIHESRAVRSPADGFGTSGAAMQGMEMHPVAEVALPPGGRVLLAPGGTHVMLVGLRRPLVAGESFPVTFEFARAGVVTVRAIVRA